MQINIDAKEIQQLGRYMKDKAPKRIRREIHIAINKTAKTSKRIIAKEVKGDIALPQKVLMKYIDLWQLSTEKSLTAKIRVNRSKRISLKEFKPSMKKTGVRVRTNPKKGSRIIPGAFTGGKPGRTSLKLRGHVFRRKGSERKPIERLHGPSVWGVFVKGKKKKPSVKVIRRELKKQIDRRLQFWKTKFEGKI